VSAHGDLIAGEVLALSLALEADGAGAADGASAVELDGEPVAITLALA
jgi:hypothetical protein